MENYRDQIREVIAKLTPNLSEKDKNTQEELLHEVFDEGKLLKDVLHVSDQAMEYLYSQAYRLYTTGKYQESLRFFRILFLLNPKDSRFPMGIAACQHMQKEYARAIEWYLVWAGLDDKTPLPYYHISDCFLKLDEKLSAFVALQMLQVRLENGDPQYEPIREKSERMMEALKNEINSHKDEVPFELESAEPVFPEEKKEAVNREK